jgi:hypothetical protein
VHLKCQFVNRCGAHGAAAPAISSFPGGHMGTRQPAILSFLLFAALCGCSKNTSTSGQPATLALKDGTTVAGTVTKSDTSSITIQTPNGVVSTYPLAQVAAVNYGPASGSASSAATGQPAANQTATEQSPTPSAAPAESAGSNAPEAASPAGAPASAQAPGPPPERDYQPAATFRTIPADRTIAVRTNQTIDSKSAEAGQTYSGVVARDVLDNEGQLAIPRGSGATLVVRDVRDQGRVQGQSALAVDVASVRVDGHIYRLETRDFVERGRQGVGVNRRTAEFSGGGGALGGILGAIAGGGRGAAIGALSGAAAGAATQSLTRGKGVRIPAETVITFRLETPIRIREMR